MVEMVEMVGVFTLLLTLSISHVIITTYSDGGRPRIKLSEFRYFSLAYFTLSGECLST